jgi:hypothetical protein
MVVGATGQDAYLDTFNVAEIQPHFSMLHMAKFGKPASLPTRPAESSGGGIMLELQPPVAAEMEAATSVGGQSRKKLPTGGASGGSTGADHTATTCASASGGSCGAPTLLPQQPTDGQHPPDGQHPTDEQHPTDGAVSTIVGLTKQSKYNGMPCTIIG